jgi:superoxide reductase
MSEIAFYRCEKCGNMVAMIKKGGGTLVCCGQPMTKLDPGSTDAAQEKHVPAIVRENGKIKVTVGTVLHPMLPEHHIEWIAIVADNKLQMEFLQPGMEPKAEFNEAASGTVYGYCNLHGLWKTDF